MKKKLTVSLALGCLLMAGTMKGSANRVGFNYVADPVIVNDKPLDYALFSLQTRGLLKLAMTENNAPAKFRIYLKRRGAVVNIGASSCEKEISQIEVSQVLRWGRVGDQLVIEPAAKQYEYARRSIFLFDTMFNFLFVKQDGC